MSIYPYVYKITNNITGQYYYGSRYAHIKQGRCPHEDLGVYYFSSSRLVKEQIKIFGKQSFSFDLLYFNAEYDECMKYENLLIKENFDDPLILNRWFLNPENHSKTFYKDSEETRMRKSLAKKGKPSNGANHIITQESIEKQIQSRKKTWELMSEDKKHNIRNKISQGNIGKPKKYVTACQKKFLCRLSDKKEMSKPTASLCFPDIKHQFLR